MWYSKNNLLSYNALLNFIIGMRGGGKTYELTKWCITDYLKNKKQFIWVRRYETELTGASGNDVGVIKSFFKAIETDKELLRKYPNLKLETKGHKAFINGELAGYFIPLSTAHTKKSVSYPQVNKIIFDEFLIDKAVYNYLRNECVQFLDLIETVDRQRDETVCVLVGNALTFANPYFMYFNIKPFKGKYYSDKNSSICVEMYFNEEFANSKRQSRLGHLIKGTQYESYAIDNKFLLDNDKFIENKTPTSKYRCSITYKGVCYGFWVDFTNGKMYCNRQYDPDNPHNYCLSKSDHDINLLLVKNLKGTYINEVVFCFTNGILRFNDINTKSQILEVLSYFIR